MLQRRQFLQSTLAALASGVASTSCVNARRPASPPLIDRLGLQLFTVPLLLERDLESGLRQISEIGYRELELYGPFPFSVESAQAGWRAITPMLKFTQSGYFGVSVQQFKTLLDRYGLSTPSMHIDLETLQTNLGATVDAAHLLGQRYAGLASIPEDRRRTLDDYLRMADVFNELGARMARQNLRLLYHNHGYGLAPVDGKVPLYTLIERLDPAVVSLEMDIYWTTAGGADPVTLFDAYPGRYRLVHLKDMKQRMRFDGDGGSPAQWVKLFPYMANAGEGVLDIPDIVAHAKKSGVQHFLVEYDMAADPLATLRANYRYLSKL
jgi:sugar phosphate isomerase/epimerase